MNTKQLDLNHGKCVLYRHSQCKHLIQCTILTVTAGIVTIVNLFLIEKLNTWLFIETLWQNWRVYICVCVCVWSYMYTVVPDIGEKLSASCGQAWCYRRTYVFTCVCVCVCVWSYMYTVVPDIGEKLSASCGQAWCYRRTDRQTDLKTDGREGGQAWVTI